LTGFGWWFIDHISWALLATVATALWLHIRPTRRSKIRLAVALTLYFTALALPSALGAIFISLQVGAFLSFPMVLVSVIQVGDDGDGIGETLGQSIVHGIEDWLAPKKDESSQ
jgi:hypothetical protein